MGLQFRFYYNNQVDDNYGTQKSPGNPKNYSSTKVLLAFASGSFAAVVVAVQKHQRIAAVKKSRFINHLYEL